MARLQAAGYSVRQIAASLDRSPSTVARELKRNGPLKNGSPGLTNRPMGDGAGPGWSGTGVCGSGYSGGSRCHLSRWQVGWRWSQARGSSPMRGQMARKKEYEWRPSSQVEAGLARPQRGQSCLLHGYAAPDCRASAECCRPPDSRALGSGPDAVQDIWTCGAPERALRPPGKDPGPSQGPRRSGSVAA